MTITSLKHLAVHTHVYMSLMNTIYLLNQKMKTTWNYLMRNNEWEDLPLPFFVYNDLRRF